MSSKIKKKSEKIKKKVIKRATLKQAYTEKELVELKSKYSDIISHLSLFLSEHNVYEAVPENVKLLVFNSELSFYEIIKIFIFEDIYCGLIYDQKINNYIGLITTKDIMILHKYIIDNFPPGKIADFSNYLKTIFSNQKMEQNEQSIEQDSSREITMINNDINIFKHLTDVNYMDYLKYSMKKEFKNIYMHSALLDDNLLETIMRLNIKQFDRLLVEEEKKNGNIFEQNLPANQNNEKMEQNKKVESSETVKTKTINSKSEKTTTANDSDEENKNNQNQTKKDIKKIIEQNEESITEEPTNNIKLIRDENDTKDKPKKVIKKIIHKIKDDKNVSEGKNNNNKKEGEKSTDKPKKKIIKKVIKKKKNFAEETKTDESNLNDNTNDNIVDNDISRDEQKPKVKKIIKKEETLETINVNALESNKKESLPKRKKIIKRKKKPDELSELSDQSHTLKESRTDDELAPKTKRIFKKKVKQERRTTFDVPMSKNDDSVKCEKEVIYRDGKKIIRKKIIKKKIIKKKKKKTTNENNIKIYDQNKSTTNEENTIEISDETNNIKSTTGGGDDTQSIVDKEKEKDKYELPKIKMRKITAKRNKNEEEKEKENKNDSNESKENEKSEDSKDKEEDKKKDINENKEHSDKEKEEEKENNEQKKDKEIKNDENEEKNKDKNKESQNKDKKEEENNENNSNINDNEIKDNKEDKNGNNNVDKENINIDKEKIKKEEDDEININDNLSKIYSKEIKNYIGVVNNDTIFEYLIVNYYSNDMKEFNLSLNELLFLGDTPFIQKLDKGEDLNEKVYNTFNKFLFNNSDIIPINNGKEIVGFIYPKDFLYYMYNCESKQSLTNNGFLENLYKDIDEEKPYGKNRVVYMEINNKNKEFYIKELLEQLNCSIEKKIVLYEPNDNSILYLISLKTIFKAIVEFQSKNK
mgnify:CR=1 FL=1